MKSIILHGLAPDNAGNYHPAGATLTVGDEAKAGCIAAERAEQLVKIHSASSLAEKADKKPD